LRRSGRLANTLQDFTLQDFLGYREMIVRPALTNPSGAI
jgi:hypothetical protein